jgi:hypothetical protein
MSTQVWFRNPHNYIRECIEQGIHHLAFDRGLAVKKSIDVPRWADLYFRAPTPYRILMVGEQGTAELRRKHGLTNPHAVFPTWEYGAPLSVLEGWIEENVGMDEERCSDTSVPPDERPVFGQEHRIVITRTPPANTSVGRSFFRLLAEYQDENPDVILHVHGLYAYRFMFGLGFASVDADARVLARLGKVNLPNGKEVTFEQAATTPHWVRAVGFSPRDLLVPRNRCMFNIKSHLWAAEHYRSHFAFRTVAERTDAPPDKMSVTKSPFTKKIAPSRGDKFLCDLCSLQDTCKYFRAGSVCTLPDSEPSELAKMFKSKDADTIVDGLSELLVRMANRAERGIEDEEVEGELSPAVTRALSDLFANGVRLAKLRNPELAGHKTQVGVQVTVGGGALSPAAQVKMLTAEAVKALEAQGIPRASITPEMLKQLLPGGTATPVMEAEVVEDDD